MVDHMIRTSWLLCLHSWYNFDLHLYILAWLIIWFFKGIRKWVLTFWVLLLLKQEVTFCHPKRSIKNHTVMFWNATFANSRSLDYPEGLRCVIACATHNNYNYVKPYCAYRHCTMKSQHFIDSLIHLLCGAFLASFDSNWYKRNWPFLFSLAMTIEKWQRNGKVSFHFHLAGRSSRLQKIKCL